jgi:hypothetical protein
MFISDAILKEKTVFFTYNLGLIKNTLTAGSYILKKK